MFGYFDPQSLKVDAKKRRAEITFVDCADAQNTKVVEINTAKEARNIAQKLVDQSNFQIASIDGQITELRGSIAFSKTHPNEAVMHTIDPKRVVAMQTNFSLESGQLPRMGSALVRGVEFEGAFIAHMMVVKPATPGMEPRRNGLDRASA